MTQIKIVPKKSGNGFKAVINNEWFYIGRAEMERLVEGRQKGVTLKTIDEIFGENQRNYRKAVEELKALA